jgi:type VI protein secretion system component VasK
VEPDNPNLRGVRVSRAITLWVRLVARLLLVGVLFYALFRLLDSGDGRPVDPAMYLGALFVLVVIAALVAGRRRGNAAAHAVDPRVLAEALRLRDEYHAAVPKLQQAIGQARGPWRQANLLALLGRCVEGRGDFA